MVRFNTMHGNAYHCPPDFSNTGAQLAWIRKMGIS